MTTAEQIIERIGPAVLHSITRGEKGPRAKDWQKRTLADMTPEYLAALNHGNNIGVLLGEPSEGLCAIDADGDEGSSGVQENGFGRNCFYAGCIRYDTVSWKKHLQGRGGTKSTHRGSAKGTHRGRGEKHPEFITMGVGLRVVFCSGVNES